MSRSFAFVCPSVNTYSATCSCDKIFLNTFSLWQRHGLGTIGNKGFWLGHMIHFDCGMMGYWRLHLSLMCHRKDFDYWKGYYHSPRKFGSQITRPQDTPVLTPSVGNKWERVQWMSYHLPQANHSLSRWLGPFERTPVHSAFFDSGCAVNFGSMNSCSSLSAKINK